MDNPIVAVYEVARGADGTRVYAVEYQRPLNATLPPPPQPPDPQLETTLPWELLVDEVGRRLRFHDQLALAATCQRMSATRPFIRHLPPRATTRVRRRAWVRVWNREVIDAARWVGLFPALVARSVNSAEWAALCTPGSLASLQWLKLEQATTLTLRDAASMPNLTTLWLAGAVTVDDGVLAALPRLTRLVLCSAARGYIGDDAVATRADTLTSLWLAGGDSGPSSVTDAGVARLTNLTELRLSTCQGITGACFAALPRLRRLVLRMSREVRHPLRVAVGRTYVMSLSLVAADLPMLEELEILSYVQRPPLAPSLLARLTTLTLFDTFLGVNALRCLTNLTSLRGDEFIIANIVELGKLPRLRKLWLHARTFIDETDMLFAPTLEIIALTNVIVLDRAAADRMLPAGLRALHVAGRKPNDPLIAPVAAHCADRGIRFLARCPTWWEWRDLPRPPDARSFPGEDD